MPTIQFCLDYASAMKHKSAYELGKQNANCDTSKQTIVISQPDKGFASHSNSLFDEAKVHIPGCGYQWRRSIEAPFNQ